MISFPLIESRKDILFGGGKKREDSRENDSARSTMARYGSRGRREGVVFHELSRPRYPRVKFQWLFDRAPPPRRPTYVHELQNIVTRRDTAAPLLFSRGFSPGVKQCYAGIFHGPVCLRARVIVIPIRFVEHVFFNETIAQSKSRLIQGVRNR